VRRLLNPRPIAFIRCYNNLWKNRVSFCMKRLIDDKRSRGVGAHISFKIENEISREATTESCLYEVRRKAILIV